MGAEFEVLSGTRSGARIPIPAGGLVVGREAEGAARLLDDESLSRRHARVIAIASGDVLIEDLGSTNGTYVNDVRIEQPVLLRDGDVVRVGDTWLEFRAGGDRDETASTQARRGVAIGGGVHAAEGSIGAIGDVRGDVDLSRRTVTAAPGGYAAGRDIHQRYEYDASGLGIIARARGPARLLLVLGTLVAFAGFALFAYPIVKGVIGAASGASATDAAIRECDRFPFGSQDRAQCLIEAGRAGDDEFPSLTPWLPFGAALFFGGMVLSTIGFFLIRRD